MRSHSAARRTSSDRPTARRSRRSRCPGPYFFVSNVTDRGSPRRQCLVAVTSTLSPLAAPTVIDPFRFCTRIHRPAGIFPDQLKVLSLLLPGGGQREGREECDGGAKGGHDWLMANG